MKVAIKIDHPGSLQVTAEITMSLKEWEEIAEVLPQKYPHWKLASAIQDIVRKASESFAVRITEG